MIMLAFCLPKTQCEITGVMEELLILNLMSIFMLLCGLVTFYMLVYGNFKATYGRYSNEHILNLPGFQNFLKILWNLSIVNTQGAKQKAFIMERCPL